MKARLEWLDQQWNKPDRTDHYLMSIVLAIRQILAKNPKAFKLDDQKINFEFKEVKPIEPEVKKQGLLARAKAGWGAFLGKPGTPIKPEPQRQIKIVPGAKLKDPDA